MDKKNNAYDYDVIVVGAGVSGSFIAAEITAAGRRVLLLEAGRSYVSRKPPQQGGYPRHEIDANSQLYWGGGIEFNSTADIGFLRPKCVGGGSVVNQALLDRFDDIAFDSWRKKSGVSFFSNSEMAAWYDVAESRVCIQTIPEKHHNGNADVFRRGFEANGYKCAPLKRAQRDCKYEEGNDCIECLAGCALESKQSSPWTTLKRAADTGLLTLVPEFEVMDVRETSGIVRVTGKSSGGLVQEFLGKRVVLASGAIGNTRLLLASGFQSSLPALGTGFYTHPQYMSLAIYDQPINAHKGPFQALKSDDASFRKQGFKLENVFAPPVAIAMLIPGFGIEHMKTMGQITHFACIEVAVRDSHAGRIELTRDGRTKVTKKLNSEDAQRRDAGLTAVGAIFKSTGAKKVIAGGFPIGLHLMGGCALGTDSKLSVVGPNFRVHGTKNIYCADSSVFPDAPGINPSLTIMALSARASQEVLSS